MKVLETPRLIVRHLTMEDLDIFAEICHDAEVVRFVGDGQPLTRQQVALWIMRSQNNYQNRGFGCFAVVHKESQQMIGYAGFALPDNAPLELVYGFDKSYWGQGLASEVAQALIEYGLNSINLAEILATVDPDNIASVRILEKLGFKFLRQSVDEHGLPTAFYLINQQNL